MTLPLFYRSEDNSFPDTGEHFVLTGQPAHHAHNVLRLQVADVFRYADGDGKWVDARITEIGASGKNVSLHAQVLYRGREDQQRPRIHLVQALAKGDRDLQAIETATEYGVDAISPLTVAHCEVQWRGPRAEKSHQKWVNRVTKAGQQARRSRIPEVGPLTTAKTVADWASSEDTLVVVMDETGKTSLDQALVDLGPATELTDFAEIIIVVGPEGGFSPEERNMWLNAGAMAVRLGQIIMRTSSAGPALIAVLNKLLKRW